MEAELKALRAAFEKNVKHGEESSGKGVMWSEKGPASLALVKALIDAVEAQAKEIERLKHRPSRTV